MIKPFYIYDHEVPHKDDGALFHYTKPDTLFDILKTMTLKTSSLSEMNDINEVNVSTYNLCDVFWEMQLQEFLNIRCSTISFCQNYSFEGYQEEGSNHPRMWSLYADDNKGACIVIDEKSFLEINKDVLQNHFYKMESVDYSFYLDHTKPCSNESALEYTQRNYREIFFQKHFDWSQECEKRLFGIDLPKYLNIKGAIKHICLGPHFTAIINHKDNFERLNYEINDRNSLSFNYLSPHSFAIVNYGKHGYSTHSATHLFMKHVTKRGKI